MENFFQEHGRKYLLFFYNDQDTNDKSAATKAIKARNKVQIMESSDISLKGICIFFVRNQTITITNANVSNVR
jgi:hypothetical protein